MKRSLMAVLLMLIARLARAHSEPIDPSVCTLASLELSAPGARLTGSAAAPGAADVLRQVYDPATGSVTFCPADPINPATQCSTTPSPRAFTMGTVSGTLAFPLSFNMAMLAIGDLTVVDVPVAIDVGGGTVSVPMLLTTGLVSSAGGGLLEGAPVVTGGAVTFVGAGTATGLVPPLGGEQLLLRGSCTLTPPPDLDQFPLTPTITRTTGRIAADGVRLRLVVALQPGQTASLSTNPALLRLHAGETELAAVTIPAGLAGTKRKFEGTAADGATVTVHMRSAKRYVLTATLPAGSLPPGATGKVSVEVTQKIGGLLSRAIRTFKANRKGTVLRAG